MNHLKNWIHSLGEGHKINVDEAIVNIGDIFPLLKELKNTEQDPQWHAEGNVHIHTDMVLEELYKLFEGPAEHLSNEQRQTLVLGALLHDIAKPLCTKRRDINGAERVIAPQHESDGRSYLAYRIAPLGLSSSQERAVMGLVGEHHMPKLLIVKNSPKGHFWRLARSSNMELLYWLEVADMQGRICEDKAKQLNILEEFKLFSEEYGVWQHSAETLIENTLLPQMGSFTYTEQEFIYSHAQYDIENNNITQIEEALPKTYAHRSDYSDLVVLCGPSGSGKSTWINKHCKNHRLISLDEIREEICGDRTDQRQNGKVLALAKERLRESLRRKEDAVWDATNLREDFRKVVTTLGKDYHALVSLICFQLDIKDIQKRNRKREYAVPEDILTRQIETVQWPSINESHRFSIINHAGETTYSTGQLKR